MQTPHPVSLRSFNFLRLGAAVAAASTLCFSACQKTPDEPVSPAAAENYRQALLKAALPQANSTLSADAQNEDQTRRAQDWSQATAWAEQYREDIDICHSGMPPRAHWALRVAPRSPLQGWIETRMTYAGDPQHYRTKIYALLTLKAGDCNAVSKSTDPVYTITDTLGGNGLTITSRPPRPQ